MASECYVRFFVERDGGYEPDSSEDLTLRKLGGVLPGIGDRILQSTVHNPPSGQVGEAATRPFHRRFYVVKERIFLPGGAWALIVADVQATDRDANLLR